MDDAAPTPNLVYEGQLYSRESAAAALTAFDADKDRVAAALGGDTARQLERAAYRMMANGHQPGAPASMPFDANGIHEQMADREAAITDARLDTFAKHTRQTPELRMQFKRRLATQEQHDFAVNERARLLNDRSFRASVLAGNADAVDRWVKIVQAAAAPVAARDYDWSKDIA